MQGVEQSGKRVAIDGNRKFDVHLVSTVKVAEVVLGVVGSLVAASSRGIVSELPVTSATDSEPK